MSDESVNGQLGSINARLDAQGKDLGEVKRDLREMREDIVEVRESLSLWKGKMAGIWTLITAATGAGIATIVNWVTGE